MEKDDLIGLPDGEIVKAALARLSARMEEIGVNVEEDYSDPGHARFVGIFEDRTIILYPTVAPAFALWFTVVHLYGHMTQLTRKTPRVDRANELVLSAGRLLTPDDVQTIYDHEREAAEIGRALIATVEPRLDEEMELDYTRFFHADFRYLINVIETGQAGVDVFAKYWRHEPNPRELILPDPRPLLDMRNAVIPSEKIIVL